MYLKKFLFARRFRDPNEDRGDTWTPTDDDAQVAERLDPGAADPEKAKTDAELLKEVPKAGETDPVEQTEEEKAAAAAEAAKGGKKDTRIPAARHKEILDKEREKREQVERELAQYKQGGKIADLNAELTQSEKDLVAMEKDYTKLLTDGEPDKAAAKMSEIRRLERTMNAKTAEMRETAAVARAVETTRYETTVDRLENLYPALNIDHDDFDKAKTIEVMELKDAYQLKGYTPSQALQKAVRLIMPPTTKAQETALTAEARVDPKDVEAQRKAAAAAKTAEAVAKTPPNTAKAGKDHTSSGGGAVTAKDAMKMPYADFVKLDEATLATMRGDTL